MLLQAAATTCYVGEVISAGERTLSTGQQEWREGVMYAAQVIVTTHSHLRAPDTFTTSSTVRALGFLPLPLPHVCHPFPLLLVRTLRLHCLLSPHVQAPSISCC